MLNLATLGGIGIVELLLLLIIPAIFIWPSWRICVKTGLPGALGIFAFIPFGLIVLLFVWAFMDWPGQNKSE